MSNDESREVTASDIENLTGKLEAFANNLEPAERALLEALVSSAGGVDESEVEGFSMGGFRNASIKAMDPFKGGMLSGDLLGGGTLSANWGRWSKQTADGWSRDIDHQPTSG